MDDLGPTRPPDSERGELDKALHHIKEAEHDLRKARADEAHAEHELKEAAEELKRAEELEAKSKTVTIVVDGTPHEVPRKEHITYVEVVTLAYPDYPQHPEVTYSVTYTRGHGEKPEGILSPAGSVKVKEGMAFVVNRTGQS